MPSPAEIESQIREKREELEQLEHALKVAQQEPPEHQLARTLHDLLCHWNHTDGCGWYYEVNKGVHDWSGSSHSPYLQKSRALIKACEQRCLSTENAIEIFRLVKAVGNNTDFG